MTADPLVSILLAFLFTWAFAEAVSWPLVPDAPMAVVAFLIPEVAGLSVAAIALGSVAGGVVGLVMGRRGRVWPLPMVTDRMRAAVSTWLNRGAMGLMYQPLTAVPYKAFVAEAARRPIGLVPWSMATAAFRGMRMAAVAVLAIGAQSLVSRWVPPGQVLAGQALVLAAGGFVFLVGWRLAYRAWQRDPATGGRPAPGSGA